MADLQLPQEVTQARASDALRACAAALEDGHLLVARAPAYILLCETAIVALRRLQLQLAADHARLTPGVRVDYSTLLLYPTKEGPAR